MSYFEIMLYDLLLSQVGRLIEKKHEHLLVSVQRYFVVRHFCLHMLKEMRLSKLKALSQTDFRAVLMEDPSKSQSCVNSTLKVRKMYSFIKTLIQAPQKKKACCKIQYVSSTQQVKHCCCPMLTTE